MLLLALTLACGSPLQETAVARPELVAALAEAVDAPTAKDRGLAAKALLRAHDATLDEWLVACAALRPATSQERGTFDARIPLRLDGRDVEGEVWVHVPADLDLDRPAPLVVAMHGTGGNGRHMLGMWTATCDAWGALLLCPSEPGENVGFAATDAERDAVLQAVRWMRRRYDVDEDSVFLTGFSRGGHLTWDLGVRYPDRWAGLAPMVGGPRLELARGANNFRYLENLADLPVRDLQGAQDQAGLVWSVREAFRRLEELEVRDARLFEFPELGHSVNFDAVDWGAFLQLRRDPDPDRIVRRYARAGEGRAHWLECRKVDKKKVQEIFRPTITQREASGLDDEGMRRFLIDAADERTGRVEARFRPDGSLAIEAEGVRSARLLLPRSRLPEDGQKLEVRAGTRTRRLAIKEDASVLLEEFVERFDRRFLPVAAVQVTLR